MKSTFDLPDLPLKTPDTDSRYYRSIGCVDLLRLFLLSHSGNTQSIFDHGGQSV